MLSRRDFLVRAAAAPVVAAAPAKGEVSLAAWSLVKSYAFSRRWANLDLPRITREEFGLGALELVSLFFENPTFVYLRQLKQNAEKHGVRLVRIMVDDEGNMSAVDKAERMEASVAHRRWIDAAHYLGCTDIRANMRGGLPEWKKDKDLVKRGAESFRHLLEYARAANVGVIVETHGGASSDPGILTSLMKEVNDPAFGVLGRSDQHQPGGRLRAGAAPVIAVCQGHFGASRLGAGTSRSGLPHRACPEHLQGGGFPRLLGHRIVLRAFVDGSCRALRRDRHDRCRCRPASREEQLWQDDLKGVRLTQAVLAKAVFAKS